MVLIAVEQLNLEVNYSFFEVWKLEPISLLLACFHNRFSKIKKLNRYIILTVTKTIICFGFEKINNNPSCKKFKRLLLSFF